MKKNMDIDEKLNEVIIRYKIDRFHPRFAKCIKAKQLLKELFEKYKDKDIFIAAACQTDIDYIQEACNLRNSGRGGDDLLFRISRLPLECNGKYSSCYSIFLWQTRGDVAVK